MHLYAPKPMILAQNHYYFTIFISILFIY